MATVGDQESVLTVGAQKSVATVGSPKSLATRLQESVATAGDQESETSANVGEYLVVIPLPCSAPFIASLFMGTKDTSVNTHMSQDLITHLGGHMLSNYGEMVYWLKVPQTLHPAINITFLAKKTRGCGENRGVFSS